MFCAGGRCCRLRFLSATQLSHRELQYNSAHAPHHGEFSCCLGSSARGGEGMVSQSKRCSQACFIPSASSQGKHAAGMASWLQPGQFWDGEKRTKLPRVLLPQCMLAPSLFLHLGLEFSLVTGFIVSVSDSVRFYGKNLLGTGLRSPWALPWSAFVTLTCSPFPLKPLLQLFWCNAWNKAAQRTARRYLIPDRPDPTTPETGKVQKQWKRLPALLRCGRICIILMKVNSMERKREQKLLALPNGHALSIVVDKAIKWEKDKREEREWGGCQLQDCSCRTSKPWLCDQAGLSMQTLRGLTEVDLKSFSIL